MALRIQKLREDARERNKVTVDSLTAELDEARALALADPKGAAAAVSATMGKAKLHGLLTDKLALGGADDLPPIKSEVAFDLSQIDDAKLEQLAAILASTGDNTSGDRT